MTKSVYLLHLLTNQAQRWVIWYENEQEVDDLWCQAGRLVSFPSEQAARDSAAAHHWQVNTDITHYNFLAITQQLRGKRPQADASALLEIWNLSMDLAHSLNLLSHPVLKRDGPHDQLHDQLTALPWLVTEPVRWNELDLGVLKQVLNEATALFEG